MPLPLALSGSDTDGVIRGVNSSAGAAQFSPGVYGENTVTGIGFFAGGRFVSRGSTAQGVVGEATGSLGTGGRFEGGGTGVSAIASNPGVNGGRGLSAVCDTGSNGMGVSALVTALTSPTFGVRAESRSSQGTGVLGLATSTTGETVGVLGEAKSSLGIGVSGLASSNTGETIGVLGQAGSDSGTGVYGLATEGGLPCAGTCSRSTQPAASSVTSSSPSSPWSWRAPTARSTPPAS